MKLNKSAPFVLAAFLSVPLLNINSVFANESIQTEISFSKDVKESLEALDGETKLKKLYTEVSSNVKIEGEASEFEKGNADVYATSYDIRVDGVQIDSGNMDDVLRNGSGSIKYEPANGSEKAKLILNNLNISVDTPDVYNEDYMFIDSKEEIDLILKGDNTINIKVVEGSTNTDKLENVYAIRAEHVNCYGGGSLSLNIDAENPTNKLGYIAGISPNTGGEILDSVNININMHGYTSMADGIVGFKNINKSNLRFNFNLGYNAKLIEDDYRRAVSPIVIYEDGNITSSDITINIEPREGFDSDKAELIGLEAYGLNISGNTSITAKGTNSAMYVRRFTIKDKYKVDMEGSVYLYDSDEVYMNFENTYPGSYFILRAPKAKGALICEDMPEGKAKFNVPAEVSVIAGDSEESAGFIAKEGFDRLFYYKSKIDAESTAKIVKVLYSNNVSHGGSGSGSGGSGSGGSSGGSGSGSGGSGSSGSGGGARGGSGGGGGARGGGAVAPKKQSGTWINDNVGWWYKSADGSYPKASWQKIDNVWYVFNDAGYIVTGWHLSGGKWYYLSASGAMSTGWIQVKDKWYYLETVGKADKPQGSMYALDNTPDNYRVNESGEWIR